MELTEEEQLWRNYRKNKRSTHTRNALVKYYQELVRIIAVKMQVRLKYQVTFDELLSAGQLGLMTAIAKYRANRHTQFSTFATRRIRGAMFDDLRSVDHVTRLYRRSERRLATATRDASERLGRRPSQQEIEDTLQAATLDRKKTVECLRQAAAASKLSLDTTPRDTDHPELKRAAPEYRETDPVIALQSRDVKTQVTRGLGTVERLIIVCYYSDPRMTFGEIGNSLGISESRVCQIHGDLIERIKIRFAQRKDELV